MSKEEKNSDEREKQLKDDLMKAAKERGIDTTQLKDAAVQITQQGKSLHIKWGKVEVTIPLPSPEVLDRLWKQAGPVVVGALVALASVVVGAGVAIAAGAGGGKKDR